MDENSNVTHTPIDPLRDAKCSNCALAKFDELWGEYICTRYQRMCTQSELVMGCSNYKRPEARPSEPTPEFIIRSGATFTPVVSDLGVISWTNDKGLPNPSAVNIKGPKGDPGAPGEKGADGVDGKDGADGVNGKDGKDGKDGHTPIKGTDYFTEAEKKELANDIAKSVQHLINESLGVIENGTY